MTVSKKSTGEPPLVTRLRELLKEAGARPIKERKMFGSQAFMVRGHGVQQTLPAK